MVTLQFLKRKDSLAKPKKLADEAFAIFKGVPEKEKRMVSSLRKLLFRMLFRNKGQIVHLPQTWLDLLVANNDKCISCRFCCALCPTGALVFKEDAQQFSIFVNTAECTACGICSIVCPMNVLSLKSTSLQEKCQAHLQRLFEVHKKVKASMHRGKIKLGKCSQMMFQFIDGYLVPMSSAL